MIDKFADFYGPTHKTRKCPLFASDAADPITHNQQGELTAKKKMYLDNLPHWRYLGALLYLFKNTRPDIAYAVGSSQDLEQTNPLYWYVDGVPVAICARHCSERH